MIQVEQILRQAEDLNITLYLKNGKLAFMAPKGAFPEELKATIGANKEAIIAHLETQQTDFPSVGNIADRQGASVPRIPVVGRAEPIALSYTQQRLWFIDQLEGQSSQYNLPLSLAISGAIDINAMKSALNAIITRHEVLHSSIQTIDGKGCQVPQPERRVTLPVEDLSFLDESARKQKLEQIVAQDAAVPFSLADDVLIRARLVKCKVDEYFLLLTIHHIVSDAWSMAILMHEFSQFYRAALAGSVAALPELAIQYADFAAWQRSEQQQAIYDRRLGNLIGLLKDAPPVHMLPLDRPRPAKQDYRGHTLFYTLDGALTARLKNLAKSEQVTLFILLKSALATLIARFSGQDDVVIGFPIAGRSDEALAPLIGFFVNTLALHSELGKAHSFSDLLSNNRDKCLIAYENEAVPFDMVVDALQPERSLSHTPIFQLMFTLIGGQESQLQVEGLDIEQIDNPYMPAKVDIELTAKEFGDELKLQWCYATALFDEATMARMLESFVKLLNAVTHHPKADWRSLEILPEADRLKLQESMYLPPVPSFDGVLFEAFERNVAARGHDVAVIHKGEAISYQVLNEHANRIAHRLLASGIGKGDLVGVYLERSFHMIASLLGILKAGAAYVPMDPTYPEQRLQFILEDAELAAIITQESVISEKPLAAPDILLVDDVSQLAHFPDNNPNVAGLGGDDLAYVIYTSGSTGRPKGVLLCHKNALALVDWAQGFYSTQEMAQVLASTSINFDLSVFEIFVPLSWGGQLLLVDNILDLADDHDLQPTLINTVPSAIRALLDSGRPIKSATVNLAGEALPKQIVNDLLATTGCQRVCNLYGPSEDCTYSTAMAFVEPVSRRPAVGRPVSHTVSLILSPGGVPVPYGCIGELYLGGAGVARGYLKRPELTAERFVELDLHGCDITRFYRTGDLVRYLPDGNIDFLGRADDQVKVKGFRIELGEIETRLCQHEVIDAAVVSVSESVNDKQLVAYVVANRQIPAPELRQQLMAYLRTQLPAYMLPEHIVLLDALPLTPNGKVDKKRLPRPAANIENKGAQRLPSNTTEQQLLDIWQRLLKNNDIGVDDNFFSVGGDSILSIQVVSEARRANLVFTTRELFEYPSIAALAAQISSRQVQSICQKPVSGEQGLTAIMREHFKLMTQWNGHYNQALTLQSSKPLNEAFLRLFAESLTTRHDVLRLSFSAGGAHYRESGGVAFEVTELEATYSEAAVLAVIKARAEQAQAELQIENGTLMKLLVFRQSEGQTWLVWMAHHLVVDGVSWRILLSDLCNALSQYQSNGSIALAAKTHSFKTWTQQLEELAHSDTIQKQLSYWQRHHFVGTPLPTKALTGIKFTERSSKQLVSCLSTEVTEQLIGHANHAYRTNTQDVLLTATYMALREWSGRQDLTVMLESHGRDERLCQLDVSETIGWFTAAYPQRLNFDHRDPNALVVAIKEQLRAVPDNGLGYGLLSKVAQAEPLSGDLATTLLFNYFGQTDQAVSEDSPFRVTNLPIGNLVHPERRRTHQFGMNAMIRRGQLQLALDYSEQEFDELQIRHLLEAIEQNVELLTACLSKQKISIATPSDFSSLMVSKAQLDNWQQRHYIDDMYPATPVQRGMLFHSDMDSAAYMVQIELSFKGSLNLDWLRQSWQAVANAHAVLRTVFVSHDNGEQIQLVRGDSAIPFHECALDFAGFEVFRNQLARENLTGNEQLPYRLDLCRIEDERHVLLWTFHHALLDGWSSTNVLAQVLRSYHALAAGQPSALPMASQYRAYVDWLLNSDPEPSRDYWRDRLQDAFTGVPLDNTGLPGHSGIAKHTLVIGAELVGRLNQLAQVNAVTMSSLVQGAWGYLIHKYSGEEKVSFGTTLSGRPATIQGIEDMVGLFINTVPVVMEFDAQGTASVLSMLKRTHQTGMLLEQHSQLPLTEIQRCSGLSQSQNLFDTLVVYRNYPIDESALSQIGLLDLTLDGVKVFDQTHYPLALIIDCREELMIRFEYDRARLSESSVLQLASHLENILTGLEQGVERPLNTLALLSEKDWHQVLVELNQTDELFEQDYLMHQLFEQQVEKTPDEDAMLFNSQRFSYREINERANRLAHYLINEGVGSETLVGLFVERGPDMIIGLLAILKAGGTYIPVDTIYPQRLADIVEESRMEYLLTGQQTVPAAEGGPKHVIYDDASTREKIAACSGDNPRIRTKLGNMAYVAFTSGSTGKPKGVMQTHQTVNNLIQTMVGQNQMSGRLNTLQFTSIGFDVSVMELGACWFTGSTLVLLDNESRQDFGRMLDVISFQGVGRIYMAYSVLNALLTEAVYQERDLPALRQIITGSERVLVSEAISTFLSRHPQCTLWNEGGPTETHSVGARKVSDYTIGHLPPVGRTRRNLRVYILDKAQQPVPFGAVGELYIGGIGVAKGYLNRPDLTEKAFVVNPVTHQANDIVYRTGDLARYLPGADLELLGRIDEQVKIRGYRVELSEVESQINRLDYVARSFVTTRSLGGNLQLVAYVSLHDIVDANADIDSQIKADLSKQLPDYMVPVAYAFVESFPVTQNGKIDRRALPPVALPVADEAVQRPIDPVQIKLASIWRQVLGADLQVGPCSNFYELGGHSLTLAQLAVRVRKAFATEVDIKALYATPILSEMAALLANGTEVQQVRIEPLNDYSAVPLSFAQERLWFVQQMNPNSTVYNMDTSLRFSGAVDIDLICEAFNHLMSRHWVLRTCFMVDGGKVNQHIMDDYQVPVTVVDMYDETEITKDIIKRRAVAYDLTVGPLWRVVIYRRHDSECVVSISLHHAVTDAWSENLIRSEFMAIYQALQQGKAIELVPLTLQYADFAQWERQQDNPEYKQQGLNYWRNKLAGRAPVHELPLDTPRSAATGECGKWLTFSVEAKVFEQFQNLCQARGVTLYMGLLGAFSALVSKLAGQSEITVGTSFANRPEVALEQVVGFFVNTVAIGTDVDGSLGFGDYLETVRDDVLEAQQYQNISFDAIVADLQLPAGALYHPVFQLFFVLQNAPAGDVTSEGLTVMPFEVDDNRAMFDLMLDMKVDNGQLLGRMNFKTDLFDEASIQKMIEKFNKLLAEVVSDPSQAIAKIALADKVALPGIRRARRTTL